MLKPEKFTLYEMNSNTVMSSWMTRTSPTRTILTQDNHEHLPRAIGASFKTMVSMGAGCEVRHSDGQNESANKTGRRVVLMEKIACKPK